MPFQAGAPWPGLPFAEQQVGRACSPHTRVPVAPVCALSHSSCSQQVSECILRLMYSSTQLILITNANFTWKIFQDWRKSVHLGNLTWMGKKSQTQSRILPLSVFQNYTMHSYTSSKQLFLLGTPHKWAYLGVGYMGVLSKSQWFAIKIKHL